MAKASWNTVSKTSGTGNDTFTTGGSVHTGRSSRTSTNTLAAEGAASKTVAVTQSAAGNILRNDTPATIPAAGGSITVSGLSNESLLAFSITGSGFSIANPQISTDGGRSWVRITSGAAISGDPGAAAAYLWQITVTATANPGIIARTGTLSVAVVKGSDLNITLRQAAGQTLSTL